MNNPNPFVPKGSLLEQQSQRRSRLKLAVFCVLAVSVTGLVAMLIQGCKREKPSDETLNPPSLDTNSVAMDTNSLANSISNPPVMVPPAPTNPPVVIPPVAPVEPLAPAAGTGSEYVVVKGDSLAKIAKKNGVTLKALQAANPGVVPTKLKVGQKLTIPAGGKTSAEAAAPAVAAAGDASGATYTVKSGDTLTKIAKKNGTTAKAIQAANGLTTTKIKVGQKLKIPSKAEAAAAAPAAPTVDNTPAPALPPVSAPAPAVPAPAPAK
jgi:LysM repeat protein